MRSSYIKGALAKVEQIKIILSENYQNLHKNINNGKWLSANEIHFTPPVNIDKNTSYAVIKESR